MEVFSFKIPELLKISNPKPNTSFHVEHFRF